MNKFLKLVLAVYLVRNVIFGLALEYPICRAGKSWVQLAEGPDAPALVKFVFDFVKDSDPLLLAMPTHLTFAFCHHVYLLVPIYLGIIQSCFRSCAIACARNIIHFTCPHSSLIE
jgi:hypothetical protein